MNSVFFFAHQDDEFGVLSSIEKHVKNNDDILCVFITDGGATASPEVRNQESISVLNELGIETQNIVFLSEQFKFKDSLLYQSALPLFNWLVSFFRSRTDINICYIPALEGGHPDHDVLHTTVVTALVESNSDSRALQYSLYNAKNMPTPFFKVLTPISENGPVEVINLSIAQRYRYFSYCFRYGSQWKTWVGLTPFVFLHLLFRGKQFLQSTSSERLGERPHSGVLYFEARNFLDWIEFSRAMEPILKKITNKSEPR